MDEKDFIAMLEEHRTCTEAHKVHEEGDIYVMTCLSYVLKKLKHRARYGSIIYHLKNLFSISTLILISIIAYLFDISSTLYGVLFSYGFESSPFYYRLLSQQASFTIIIFSALAVRLLFIVTLYWLVLLSRNDKTKRFIMVLIKVVLILFISINVYGFISNILLF